MAVFIAAALGLSACGSDGKDGKPGEPGEPGIPGLPGEPPVVTTSAVAKVLDWHFGDNVINVEFSVENQDGVAVEDLDRVELLSTVTDAEGLLADTVSLTYFSGDSNSKGTLTHVGDGVYRLEMPREGVKPESVGIGYIRPGNGNNGMPRTKRIMLTQTEQYAQVRTTDDNKCVTCHGDFTAATGNSAWGWHQHHHALDNDQNIVIVDACLSCHTQTEQKDGGHAKNTMAMIGHGKMSDGEGGKISKGHAALWSNYSMDMKRCSTCHIDDVDFTASINGCTTCHTSLLSEDRVGNIDHSGFTNASCNNCHGPEGYMYAHQNGTARDEALNRYRFELISVVRTNDKSGILVTVNATNVEGQQVDIANITDASPRGWATVMKNGEAMLPGRDDGHVARSVSGMTNADGSYTYLITHAMPYEEGEVLAGGIDGRISYGSKNAPISISNIKQVRRTSSDGLKCLNCHTEGLDGHGSNRGGFDLGGDACTQCHSAYNWTPAKQGEDYVMAWGPLVHNMHFGDYKDGRAVNDMPTTDKTKKVECVACHTGEINLENIAPAVVLNGLDADNVYGITPISANCVSCHSSEPAKAHMLSQGGDFNIAVTPAGIHQGEKGTFTVFDPAPIVESCSVCHSPDRMAEAHQY
ncbi:multiheme c-type cytochrome [Shewanella sp. GXUN23E]|uniref:multiheme c-type cytochrome n=1 Tax=Shewanella sp. GXUN23E TaxID=3422498 RepID=UPI003D7D5C2D